MCVYIQISFMLSIKCNRSIIQACGMLGVCGHTPLKIEYTELLVMRYILDASNQLANGSHITTEYRYLSHSKFLGGSFSPSASYEMNTT